jgi:hypothetical protein
MTSDRVDIGVFVRNKVYYSAPAFVSFYSLPNETRTYDRKGRLTEIRYDPTVLIDPRLTAYKDWRDVYKYDAQGTCTGWTRHIDGEAHAYTAHGLLVRETDEAGRPVRGERVRYMLQTPDPESPKKGVLKPTPTNQIVTIVYASPEDRVGRVEP